jgi:hypothetical protein
VSGSDEEVDHERAVLVSIVDVASAVAPASAASAVALASARSGSSLSSRVRCPVSRAPGSRLAPHPLAQRHAIDELHGDVDPIVERTDVVHRDHIRMTQARRLRFTQ